MRGRRTLGDLGRGDVDGGGHAAPQAWRNGNGTDDGGRHSLMHLARKMTHVGGGHGRFTGNSPLLQTVAADSTIRIRRQANTINSLWAPRRRFAVLRKGVITLRYVGYSPDAQYASGRFLPIQSGIDARQQVSHLSWI